jgi:mono/diheme cytochrome c family protein
MLRHAATAIWIGAATAAGAQEGDPAQGADLAEQHCARCHDIGAGGAMKQHPPAFAAIGAYRPEEQIVGRIWFPGHFSGMPEMIYTLDAAEVQSLVAYITSLAE